jgi:hypothetical protein
MSKAKITKALAELRRAAKATQALHRKRFGASRDEGESPYFLKLQKITKATLQNISRELAKECSGFVLPETYCWFVSEHGLLRLTYGFPTDAALEVEHMFVPETLGFMINSDIDEAEQPLVDRCVAFQYANDDAVENFHCFYADSSKERVLTYFHDEPFKLPKRSPDFAAHILTSIDENLELLAEYDP